MDTAKPTLIRETFPVGPLQCNCNHRQLRECLILK